jgi:FKBP-type peptidyl-prolyl cis-trans isomerase FkpA
MIIRLLLLLPALVLAGTACADADPDPDETFQPGAADPALTSAEVTTTYAPVLDVDLEQMDRMESGLRTRDVRVGTGAIAQPGDRIAVHYTGWLPDGSRFDSSVGGDPLEVVIGTGEVIRGWDEGIPGMREGGRRRLVIPPALAYGAQGAGGGIIPPGATLIFDVELVEVR